VIEIGEGSVQAGECDVMGHMNVRHYVARSLEAMAWLGLELGLGPSFARGHGAGLVPKDQHIRFLRELPAGAPFSIRGGVAAVHGRQGLRLFQEVANAESGTVAATLVTDAALVDLRSGEPRPLPAGLEAAAAHLATTVPDHATPRGLRFDPPGEPLTLSAARELGLTRTQKGAVAAAECNEHGLMRADGVIARVWDGVPHSPARAAARREAGSPGGLGSAALEYRLVYHRPVRAADLLTVHSGLKAVGGKTVTWTHWLFDGESGAAVAAAEVVGVSFDLATRKAVAMDEATRRALEGLILPGLGV
jgi:acyl-CoA thioester hydrolase